MTKLCPFILVLALQTVFQSAEATVNTQQPVTTNGHQVAVRHPCVRECVSGGASRECRYSFVIQTHQTMTEDWCAGCSRTNVTACHQPPCVAADGVGRVIVAINRQIPGPDIQVCHGDTVIVEVTNHQVAGASTIHWHGIHQRGTHYMDGVPMVTQCPIPPGTAFTYQFTADPPGTHFYHSHTGEVSDGVLGKFVVRQADDPNRSTYDYDDPSHVLLAHEWLHDVKIKFLTFSDEDCVKATFGNPIGFLINGKGRSWNMDDVVETPLEKIIVTKGKRYRIRVVNAGALGCPFVVSIDNHPSLTVIAVDGAPVAPLHNVSSILLTQGERVDFVLAADQPPQSKHFIRFRSLGECADDGPFGSVYQVVWLQYRTSAQQSSDVYNDHETEPTESVSWDEAFRRQSVGKRFSAAGEYNSRESTIGAVSLTSLTSLITQQQQQDHSNERTTTASSSSQRVDKRFYLSTGYAKVSAAQLRDPTFMHTLTSNMGEAGKSFGYIPSINDIAYIPPLCPIVERQPPLQCNEDSRRNTTTTSNKQCPALTTSTEWKYCECTHTINIDLGDTVEMILINPGGPMTEHTGHPFHMHGNYFRVLDVQQVFSDNSDSFVTVDQVKKLDRDGLIRRRAYNDAPLKDTLHVPEKGFVVIRFNANNPGYWLFHCHFLDHSEAGMEMLIQVGQRQRDIAPLPTHFPRCCSTTTCD